MYIGPKSRTERLRKTKIGTEVGHVRHTWLGHHFQGQKVKGQGHQAALLTAAFTHQAAAAMSVGTYSPWEPTATLRSGAVGSAARGASAPTEGGEGRGHIVAASRTACSIRLCRLAVLGPVIIIDVWRAGARRASGPLLTQSDCWDCWLMCCVSCAGADDVNWVINWYSYQLSVISTAADRHLHHLPYLFFPQSYCMHCHVCIVVSVQVYCKCVWLGLVSLNSAYLHLLAAVNRVKAHSV